VDGLPVGRRSSLIGVEEMAIIANFFGLSPLDLYFMPYSHGLPSAALAVRSLSAASSPRCRTQSRVIRGGRRRDIVQPLVFSISSYIGRICRSSSIR